MGEKRGAYSGLVGKPEVKRPLGSHKHRWEVSIEMDLTRNGMGWDGMGWCIDWIDLSQYRDRWQAFVNVFMNFWVP
jgi:hypothetical protein